MDGGRGGAPGPGRGAGAAEAAGRGAALLNASSASPLREVVVAT